VAYALMRAASRFFSTLGLNLYHRRTSVEMSLDTARTSACATVRQSVLAVQPLEAEDESKEPAGDRSGDGHAPNSWGENPGTAPGSRMDARGICAPLGLHRADVE